MKKVFLWITLSFASFSTFAQTGKVFPAITGTTLLDKVVSVPKDTKGKVTLIGVAYSEASEKYLEKWFSPLYSTFVSNQKSLFDIDSPQYDVNIHFIPMIKGLNQVATGKIETQMKKGIDPILHKYVLVYSGAITDYKKPLGFDSKDKPYFYVLDKEGKIVYHTSGEYTNEKLEDMEETVKKHMK